MTTNNKTLKAITTGVLASTMAVSAFVITPSNSNSNIFQFPQANAQAVRVEAVQAPSFADVVEAVSPAVVSVRVEQFLDTRGDRARSRNDDRRGFRFDRRDNDSKGRLPRFFRDHPEFEDFFNEHFGRGDDSRPGERGERGGRKERKERFSERDERQERSERGRKPRRGMSQGSGFFVSDDGYIVTNNHVIENGSKFTIIMHDGKEHEAKLVGADKRSDLAVLKIEDAKEKFTYVAFGEKDPRIGDWVVAVGNPFGLGGTVTSGIVSARGREIGASRYDDFIQIDAAVNKGNSGGPAFNLEGEVIGVNTAIFSPSGGNVGIAFAIPADTANEIVTDLIENGEVVRGWLGVQIQPVTQDIAESLGLESAQGAIVTEPQEGSPADEAGIRSGDVIVAVEGEPIKSPKDLARMIAGFEPESSVEISVWRDEEEQDISVKLGTLENISTAKNKDKPKKKSKSAKIGLALETSPDGLVVVEVLPGSPAEEKGLKQGDLLKSVNGEEVSKPQDVAKIIKQASDLGRKAALLQIERNGNSSFVAVPLKKG